ncbi:MAG TPA: copper homeostasis protein CutC, partial [Flavisolibacter sp.]|nr:copper homeostasis protein CutC [Flavisolibacter sp.]
KDGSIDVQWTKRLVELAYPMEVTFHRAFDRCRDPFEALEQIIDAGCQRILTSGQKPTALEGAELIAELVKKADGRIVIMPGSGVRPENVKALAEQTGTVEFHTSLRGVIDSVMEYRHPDFAEDAESYKNAMIDPARVRAMREALRNIEQETTAVRRNNEQGTRNVE